MIIDCRTLASTIDESTKQGVSLLIERGVQPKIVEIIATNNESVTSYSNTKKRSAARLGIEYEPRHYEQTVTVQTLVEDIARLNEDVKVHGILIGLPLFVHLDEQVAINELDHKKDVDGLGAFNTYYLNSNWEDGALLPATARAAIHILESVQGISGKRAIVIGRGLTVGRPTAQMLINRHATVTVAHSRTTQLERVVSESDIIVSATGRPGLVSPNWIVPQQVVIDCGISFVDGKTVGDIDTKVVDARGAKVTSVPGGVGIVTNAMVFSNLLKAIRLQQEQ